MFMLLIALAFAQSRGGLAAFTLLVGFFVLCMLAEWKDPGGDRVENGPCGGVIALLLAGPAFLFLS